jgi:2-iminobutanoate/2-iminopropanoate deaminase
MSATSNKVRELPATGGHYAPGRQAGDFVFTAGQVPRNHDRNVIGDTIETQTIATLANVQRVLAEFGATLDHVVKTTVHLANLSDAAAFNLVYAQHFPNSKPVRTVTGSQLNGVLVEIDVVAYLGPEHA